MSRVLFRNNTAKMSGGAISFQSDSVVTITSCSFIDSTAGSNGGALSADGQVLSQTWPCAKTWPRVIPLRARPYSLNLTADLTAHGDLSHIDIDREKQRLPGRGRLHLPSGHIPDEPGKRWTESMLCRLKWGWFFDAGAILPHPWRGEYTELQDEGHGRRASGCRQQCYHQRWERHASECGEEPGPSRRRHLLHESHWPTGPIYRSHRGQWGDRRWGRHIFVQQLCETARQSHESTSDSEEPGCKWRWRDLSEARRANLCRTAIMRVIMYKTNARERAVRSRLYVCRLQLGRRYGFMITD